MFQAAIGYNYEKNAGILLTKHSFSYDDSDASSDSDDSSFDEIDLEVTLDVDKIDSDQKRLLTTYSMAYGLKKNIFLRYLAKDKNEQESLRLSKMLEDEKAMYSGRKGRHKRREFHDEKVQLHRRMNPRMELSYVTRENRKEVEEKVKEKSVERQKSRYHYSKNRILRHAENIHLAKSSKFFEARLITLYFSSLPEIRCISN